MLYLTRGLQGLDHPWTASTSRVAAFYKTGNYKTGEKMNSWINLSVDFMDNNKTLLLRRHLGDSGIVSLLTLWIYCGTSRIDGSLVNLSDDDIEQSARWKGQSGKLIDVLVTIGFLCGDEWERYICGWDDHNYHATQAKARIESARKAGQASASARAAKGVKK